MTQIEEQILELLKQGLSYLQIQENLQVSSKTIAAVKKEYFPQIPGNDIKSKSEPAPINSDTLQDESFSKTLDFIETNNSNYSFNTKNSKTMIPDNDDYQNVPNSNFKLEKYRIKLAHDLEIIKLNAGREDKKRELDVREQEIQLERYKIEQAQNTNQEKNMLHRLKMAVKSCTDGEYEIAIVERMLQDAIALKGEFENYCSGNKILFDDSESQSILDRIIANLADYLDNYDEDEYETTKLFMDINFRQLVKLAKYDSI